MLAGNIVVELKRSTYHHKGGSTGLTFKPVLALMYAGPRLGVTHNLKLNQKWLKQLTPTP